MSRHLVREKSHEILEKKVKINNFFQVRQEFDQQQLQPLQLKRQQHDHALPRGKHENRESGVKQSVVQKRMSSNTMSTITTVNSALKRQKR